MDLPIHIVAYSDFENLINRRPLWGDYWLKRNLIHTFTELGIQIDDECKEGVLLHLFGKPLESISFHTHNILWIHSHPDWITPEILKRYDKIYCISKHFLHKLKKIGFEAEWLMMPTRMRPIFKKKEYDIVFVGNNRYQGGRRKIIHDLMNLGEVSFNINIWGHGWETVIPSKWYRGKYYDYQKLNELYSSSKIVLNDHHDDMRREGFMNPRILDALAGGSLVISDKLIGIEELVNAWIPTYNKPEELKILLTRFLHDQTQREKVVQKGQKEVLCYTYHQACKKIIRHIKQELMGRNKIVPFERHLD